MIREMWPSCVRHLKPCSQLLLMGHVKMIRSNSYNPCTEADLKKHAKYSVFSFTNTSLT